MDNPLALETDRNYNDKKKKKKVEPQPENVKSIPA